MKVIFSGLESSGKSLKLAMLVTDLAYRNCKWYEKQLNDWERLGQIKYEKKYGEGARPAPRPIWSNLKFSDPFEKYCKEELGIPIFYWSNLSELIEIQNADVICDEVGNYFDARMWEQLTMDVRRWLTQGAKMGIEFYGSAQDFAQVDKAFRRLVNHLLHIRKIVGSRRPSATKPPVQFVWGFCMVTELDPQGYDEDSNKFANVNILNFRLFTIRKHYTQIFDTLQKIKRSAPPPLIKEVRVCLEDGYKRVRYY
ncbi:hypothetical protein H7X87_04045 [Acetobacteraceae bacterium]|nr:hypothetical protein [Candidatus Parcubacteria bacterium]